MSALLSEPLTLVRRDSAGRQVFTGVEHGEIDVPAHLLVSGAGIDIYDEISQRKLLSIRGRGSKFILQAGNAVGLIPINDHVALEVNSRVPVANLERLLCLADDYAPDTIAFSRSYGEASEVARPILDFLADALVAAVEAVHDEGLPKAYHRTVRQGPPSGRILPFESAKVASSSGKLIAVSTRFERSTDTVENRQIHAALHVLRDLYAGMRNRKGALKRQSALARALTLFDRVSHDRRFRAGPLPGQLARLPYNRPNYARAVSLSSLILRKTGLEIRNTDGPIVVDSLLIQMEKVFEAYVRQVLRIHLENSNLTVLDGNLDPPAGAAGEVFHQALSASGNSRSTPDTVVLQNGEPIVVIENKYKINDGMPARDDINQALTYGFSFGSPHVVLAYPSYGDAQSLLPIGRVGGVTLHKAEFSLGSKTPEESEREFSRLIRGLAESSVMA